MLMLAATGLLQRFGDMIVVGLVLALIAYGAHFGLFLAVLAGMHALVSIVVALAFAEPVAALLRGMEVPAAYAFPAAFGALFVAAAVAIRLAVGGFVPADRVRFTPAIDKVGGGLMGALAGVVLAGAVLIAFSILPLPQALRIDGSKLRFDAGARLLGTFARCVAADEATRDLLLAGEPPNTSAPAGSPSSSELFADAPSDEKGNGNNQFDDGEPYIDADGNGAFTIQLPYVDKNGDGRREVGLVERYRLGAWRNATVLYAPTVDSPASADVPAEVTEGDVVYQIVAIDLDPNDTFTYGMRMDEQTVSGTQKREPADYQETDLLSIDKATGAVKMADAHGFVTRKAKELKIIVTVTDRHGLKAEKAVTLKRKAPKPDAQKTDVQKPASGKP